MAPLHFKFNFKNSYFVPFHLVVICGNTCILPFGVGFNIGNPYFASIPKISAANTAPPNCNLVSCN